MVMMTIFVFITGWICVNQPDISMNDKLGKVGCFGRDLRGGS